MLSAGFEPADLPITEPVYSPLDHGDLQHNKINVKSLMDDPLVQLGFRQNWDQTFASSLKIILTE